MKVPKKITLEVFSITMIILVLDLIVRNYLFFHTIAELFSISIMFVLFAITLNAQKFLKNAYLLVVGIAALFIGILDLLHTLTFTGMNIIPSPIFFANQFWIATRFFESVVLLSGFLFVGNKYKIHINALLAIYSIVTLGIILSILYFQIFPVAYIQGVGQTPFKILSEYVIISILIGAFIALFYQKEHFEKDIFVLIATSIILTIFSEFCFTLYVGNFDFLNKLGHIFKVLSFYMIYKANIENGFKRPIETFFHDLKVSEEKIKEYSQELESQIRTKNRFFSIISHDLRNPFTALFGFTELLLEKHAKYSEKERDDIIRMLYNTSHKTYQLLENLLSWSRTQTNTMPFNPVRFNIKELLDESFILIGHNARLKDIDVKRDYTSALVVGDTQMIETVLRNLLSNAVKFTPKGGTITIQTQPTEGFLQVNIIDTGVGISAEKIKQLFQIDKIVSTKGTENETGSGLGLVLSTEFVAIHKGKLWAESELDKGSRFSFTIPLAGNS
jgi:signal transduction histidine kinase